MAQEPHAPDDLLQVDDLFGKLDELIGRRQARAPRARSEPSVPTLTEAVAPAPEQLEIPVLNEVVEIPPAPPGETPAQRAAEAAPVDPRKQLQVALYLRLRQRLEEELQVALAGHSAGPGSAVDRAMAALAREMRNALPGIVREAVEQVFAAERSDDGAKL